LIEFPEDHSDVSDIRIALSARPEIERTAYNRIYKRTLHANKQYIPPVDEFGNQWHLHHPTNDKVDIDMPEAWAIERSGTNIVIVINDSGAMLDTTVANDWTIHPGFNHFWIEAEDNGSGNVLSYQDIDQTDANGDGYNDNIFGANFAQGYEADTTASGVPNYQLAFWRAMPIDNMLNAPNRGWQCAGYQDHATRVASVAAASIENGDIVGVAFNSSVYWVRYGSLPPDGASSVWDEAKGIIHSAIYADVINMSWGFGGGVPDTILAEAMDFAANDSDCVLVASVGNEGSSNFVAYPAAYPEVLAVGAVERVGSLDSLIHSSYSNYKSGSSLVDVVAPVDPDPYGVWGYRHSTYCDAGTCPCPVTYGTNWTREGTSFAAPQATGIAALIRSRFPGLDQAQVRARIKRGAEYYWSPSDSSKYGHGKVNAYRSLTEWGKIETNTTWGSVPGMPDTLYLSGDLIIESGDTLTLNPGAVIRVAPEPIQHDEGNGDDPDLVEIVVYGALEAASTGSDAVVFESFADSPTSSDWGGIKFKIGSSAALAGVMINNADVAVDVEEFDVTATNWGTNKSLYLNSALSITSDYTIASSESLLVLGDTPVTITGGQSISIEVNGTLIAKGSATKQPEFLSSTAARNSWEWIAFSDSSSGNVLHNSIVRHAKTVRTATPVNIDSCTFAVGTDGVQSYDSLHISNSHISDMTSYGIRAEAGTATVANVEIEDCAFGIAAADSTTLVCNVSHIHDIQYTGVSASGSGADITLLGTRVEDTDVGCSFSLSCSGVVDSCRFFSNDTGVRAILASSILVKRCQIDSSSTNGVYCLASSNITLQTDTICGSPVGVYCLTSSSPTIESSGWITGNTVGIKADGSSDPVVKNTRISANVDGVAALNGSNPNLGISADSCGTDINKIHGNSGYHVVNLTPTVTVSAEGNWWGSGGPKSSKFSGAVDYVPHCGSEPSPASPGPLGEQEKEDLTLREPLPVVYELSDNYPNPFNPVTSLRYGVPVPGGFVSIRIYDITGRRIKTLVAGEKSPGYHNVVWKGDSDGGSSVASGVYFVRMTAPTSTQTKKIVLLK
jgi:subtilisin family serine protease